MENNTPKVRASADILGLQCTLITEQTQTGWLVDFRLGYRSVWTQAGVKNMLVLATGTAAAIVSVDKWRSILTALQGFLTSGK